MKTPIAVLATFLAASALAAVAADPAKKELTPQQQRMSDCAHESKGMKGDAHKQFMSDCLKGKTVPGAGAGAGGPKVTPQQERMKECNAEAGKTKMAASERQKFMSACLKGEHPMGDGGMKGPADKAGMAGPAKGEAKKDPKARMKECNTDASQKKLKGDERKKFMSECLKG